MIKEVLLIFKTHLDIGYTDLARNVVSHYVNRFIPAAIRLARQQQGTDFPYIWTAGSWIIWEALKTDTGELASAIEDGLISWHALPFTSHTELMTPELFRYGLSLSRKLDSRFGKRTVAAKMTDVPGHTVAAVPLMAEAGIKLLHIGVNPATPAPDVPEIFRWKNGDSSVVTMYTKGSYGDFFEIGETAVGFGVTNDNLGPHSPEELTAYYNEVRARYPGARVYAATLDDLARCVEGLDLPVVERELGDTWIHGAGTDPKKVAGYRALLRQSNGVLANYDLTDMLLLVPEHTWGSNIERKFPDTDHYLLRDLAKYHTPERAFIESTWQEQRDYVTRAAALLGDNLKELEVTAPDPLAGEEIGTDCGVEISYQLFTGEDYARYGRVYFDSGLEWANWDFSKPNLPRYQGGIFPAKAVSGRRQGDCEVYTLRFPEEITAFCGLPVFYVIRRGNRVTVQWQGKQANRLPEAFWLKFTGMEENWELHKLGQWVKPELRKDAALLHGVWEGVRNRETEIVTLDAPLVAPFGRNLLNYGCAEREDLYFNLYNNLWNTNFPLWYAEDAKFRFELINLTLK